MGYGRATNGVMTQHEVKCTPNNQCKFFLYEVLTSTPKQIQCKYNAKMQNAMHDDKQMFLDFLKENRCKKQKNDSTSPRLCKDTQTSLKQITKVKEL